MPNRIIREGIIESESVNQLSWAEEVFYRRLMSKVDDFGRFSADARLLRAALYPLKLDKVSDRDTQGWLQATEKAGLVKVYEVDGKRFLELQKFKQQVRSKQSKYSAPPDERTSDAQHVHSTRIADAQHVHTKTESETETNMTTTSTTSAQERAGGGAYVEPYPRSAAEVAEYMRGLPLCGLRDDDLMKCAIKYFQEMEECGWLTKRGFPIAKWQAGAERYVTAWRGNLGNLPPGGLKVQAKQTRKLTDEDYML